MNEKYNFLQIVDRLCFAASGVILAGPAKPGKQETTRRTKNGMMRRNFFIETNLDKITGKNYICLIE